MNSESEILGLIDGQCLVSILHTLAEGLQRSALAAMHWLAHVTVNTASDTHLRGCRDGGCRMRRTLAVGPRRSALVTVGERENKSRPAKCVPHISEASTSRRKESVVMTEIQMVYLRAYRPLLHILYASLLQHIMCATLWSSVSISYDHQGLAALCKR